MALTLARLRLLLLVAGAVLARSSNAADGDSPGPNSTAPATDLLGWYNCSAITFRDQTNAADSFLENGGWDYGMSSDSLNAYARRAQCAQYQAPLCHAGVCEDTQGRTVDVFVKRVMARSNPESRPNVWFLQGGPGIASPTMEYIMRALYMELDGNVNVYTMDHRGTGRSTRLNCVAAQATTTGSPLGNDIDISEFAACAQELQTKYGDLAAFSTTSAATDLASFISKFQTGSKTYVYGVSYGSALVERLMHLNTKEIVGYILDGVATTSGADAKDGMYMSNWDANFGEVGDRFLRLQTDTNAGTTKFMSSDLPMTVLVATESVLADLDANPNSKCAMVATSSLAARDPSSASTKASGLVKRFLGKLLMNSVTRGFIPPVIYRLHRCNEGDREVLKYMFKKMTELLDAPSEEEALVSELEYYLIVFSEMWESPTPDVATLTTRFTDAMISSGPIAELLPLYCAFTKDNSSACAAVVNATMLGSGQPLAYKKDKYWNTAATIPDGASVLILSGRLDPQTPHKYAERLLKVLNGTSKKLVTFDYTPHGAILNAVYGGRRDEELGYMITPSRYCGVELLASYVNGAGDLTKLDETCVALTNMGMPNVAADNLYTFMFMNTRDMYDGEVFEYEDTRLHTPLIVVSVVGGMVLLCVFLPLFLSYRNRVKQAKKPAAAAAAGGYARQQTPTSATPVQPPSDYQEPRV